MFCLLSSHFFLNNLVVSLLHEKLCQSGRCPSRRQMYCMLILHYHITHFVSISVKIWILGYCWKDTIDIYTPYCSSVTLKGTQSLSIDAVPNTWMGILSRREQEIPFTIVLDLGNGPLMSKKADWFLDEEWICKGFKQTFSFDMLQKNSMKQSDKMCIQLPRCGSQVSGILPEVIILFIQSDMKQIQSMTP